MPTRSGWPARHENPLRHRSNTPSPNRTVERETVHKFGPFGLFKRAEMRSERKPFRRHVPVIGQHWVLDARHHHIEKNVRSRGSHYQETTYEKSSSALVWWLCGALTVAAVIATLIGMAEPSRAADRRGGRADRRHSLTVDIP